MPYPALPPELPPFVSSQALEAVNCPRLPEHATSQVVSAKSAIANGLARPTVPDALPVGPSPGNAKPSAVTPQTTSKPDTSSKPDASNVDDPNAATQTACAALLGDITATGYLSVGNPINPDPPSPGSVPSPTIPDSLVNSSAPSPLRPHTHPNSPASAISPPERLEQPLQKTLNPFQPSTQKTRTFSPPPLRPLSNPTPSHRSPSYSITGVSGKLATTSQTDLMNSLNQGLVFDGLTESYQAIGALTPSDLRRPNTQLKKGPIRTISQGTDTEQVNPSNPIPPNALPPGSNPFPPFSSPPISPTNPTPTTDNPVRTPGNPIPDNPIPANGAPAPIPNPALTNPANVVEVTADRQEYDERHQVFTAEGRVLMRFRGGLMDADRIQVNLTNRLTVAEGNVALTRGNQVLRGQRFEYNFVQGVGTIQAARGDIYLPRAGTDTNIPATTDETAGAILARPLSDRITSKQPQQNVTSPGGFSISVGAGRDINRVPGALPKGGNIRRLRFEAEQVEFTPEGWVAKNIQITNDPFSPPELVLKAEKATLTRLSPLSDEVRLTRPRVVFDQKVSLPFPLTRTVLSREESQPGFLRLGIDGEDRGGVFIEGIFNVVRSPTVQFSIFPQIFLQRMLIGEESEGAGDPDNYGVRAKLDVNLGPDTTLRSRAALTSFDPDKFEDKLRASIRLQQTIGTSLGPHKLAFEYSYRDRLFNGSLGFQTVRSSLGAVFFSPNIALGKSGITLNYQTGYQLITADTDRLDLLDAVRENNLVTLGRFQTSAGLSRGFTLWQGKPLPATRDQGLNYTPTPIVPYVGLGLGLRGVFSSYTSGDTQQDLIGSVSLFGQFGHFSRKFFDYTAIGVSYTQVIGSGASPFLFDRTVDDRVLSLSLFQQLYGPLRVGIQTSYNLESRNEISTDYLLEYSRRTHGIILRYNPVLEIGSISLRISDFNWDGTAEPFEGSGVTPVEGGVIRE